MHYLLTQLAEGHLQLGRIDLATEIARRALTQAQAAGERGHEAWAQYVLEQCEKAGKSVLAINGPNEWAALADIPKPVSSRGISPEKRPSLSDAPPDASGIPRRALFTVDEAMAVLGVSRQTIYRELARGRLHAHKIRGKTILKRSALVEFVDGLEARKARVA